MDIPVVSYFLAWGAPVVGIFFFITGYGLMVSYRAKGTAYLDGFLPHRLGKLLPAFILANVAWLCVVGFHRGGMPWGLLTGLRNGVTPLPNSWFIYTVLIYYLCFYLAARATRDMSRMLCALWVFSTVYIVAVYQLGWGAYWYFSVYALNVGMTYAHYEGKLKALILSRPRILVVLFAVLLATLFSSFLLLHFGLWWLIVEMMWNVLIPLIVVLSVCCLGTLKVPALSFMGKISYEVYLVQGCCISVFAGMKEYWPLYFLAVYVASIVAAWLLHVLCAPLVASGKGR